MKNPFFDNVVTYELVRGITSTTSRKVRVFCGSGFELYHMEARHASRCRVRCRNIMISREFGFRLFWKNNDKSYLT